MSTVKYMNEGGKPFWGKYRGLVVNRDDPLGRKRLKIRVPRLNMVTLWAEPCGIPDLDFVVPSIGGQVWVEFEGGEVQFPIWQFGAIAIDKTVKSVSGSPTRNTLAGRRVLGNEGGEEVILDSTRANQSAYLRCKPLAAEGVQSRIGVARGQQSIFAIGENDAYIKVGGTVYIEADGGLDIDVFGNGIVSVGGSYGFSIGAEREEVVGSSYTLAVNEEFIANAGETMLFEVLNTLLVHVAGITIEKTQSQSGKIELLVKTPSQLPGSIVLEGAASATKLTINVQGDVVINTLEGDIEAKTAAGNVKIEATAGKAEVKSGNGATLEVLSGDTEITSVSGKVKLKGLAVGGNPAFIGVLTGHTIDRFTGTPFGPGSAVASSTSVQATG